MKGNQPTCCLSLVILLFLQICNKSLTLFQHHEGMQHPMLLEFGSMNPPIISMFFLAKIHAQKQCWCQKTPHVLLLLLLLGARLLEVCRRLPHTHQHAIRVLLHHHRLLLLGQRGPWPLHPSCCSCTGISARQQLQLLHLASAPSRAQLLTGIVGSLSLGAQASTHTRCTSAMWAKPLLEAGNPWPAT